MVHHYNTLYNFLLIKTNKNVQLEKFTKFIFLESPYLEDTLSLTDASTSYPPIEATQMLFLPIYCKCAVYLLKLFLNYSLKK